MNWKELAYWKSGEYQVVQERLKDLDKAKIPYNPDKKLLFESMKATPFEKVKVAIIGQDPYPRSSHSTGIAFSVPDYTPELPPTLLNIFTEYVSDLKYPYPKSGNLNKWCEQGVFLWNVYPSCETGKPGSHHWDEWTYLTKEIVEKLDTRADPVVFALLGGVARNYSKYIDESDVIETSHPSPLGASHGFLGSRLFSTINVKLCEAGSGAIDWRL